MRSEADLDVLLLRLAAFRMYEVCNDAAAAICELRKEKAELKWDGRYNELEAERDALRADAERYKWLRGREVLCDAHVIDAAIDKAIHAARKP